MIIAEENEVTPADLAEACFSRAGDPSSIIRLPCKHYDVYRRENEEYFALAVRAATDWFTTHLMDNSKPELKTSVDAIEAH